MQVYLVGGAVRDMLLGRPTTERDWVVVGATPAQLEGLGYRPVGKDFPVFLHPKTREEYALARTERKIRPGYHGFEINADPSVTLEEDLSRRDLTINAIARDDQGALIDPFGGQQDLKKRLLRHVSPAFVEDPVRVLRVARFAARFAHLGFTVAEDTLALMRDMVANGEVDHLVAERAWMETLRALAEPAPEVYVQTLRSCHALSRILPEVDRLFGVPQPAQHHPEIDTGEHTVLALRQAARLAGNPAVCFAVLVHDVGKGLTPPEDWPKHWGHEEAGVELVQQLCERLRAPKAFRELAILVTRYHLQCHRVFELRPGTIHDLLQAVTRFRNEQRLSDFLLACEADARGRTGLENRAYPQVDLLQQAYAAAISVSSGKLLERGLRGAEIGAAMRDLRSQAIAGTLSRMRAR